MTTITDLMTTARDTAPPFLGSPKQIAWAEDIRRTLATFIQDELTKRDARGEYTDDMGITPTMLAEAQEGIAYVFGIADAKFWIDHRSKGLQGMIRAQHRQQGTHRTHFAQYDDICLSLQAMGL
jgi:hypothetical protein